jgi:hypothetical protein
MRSRRSVVAEEMLRAWREVFDRADRRTVIKPSGEEVRLDVEVDLADPDTLVATLGLSTRAANALDRAGVADLRQFLALPVPEVRFMRGVGKKTRDELIAVLDRLCRRFPEVAKVAPATDGAKVEELGTLDLDALRSRLIDTSARGKDAPSARKIRAAYLGLGDPLNGQADWPNQNDVATELRLTRQLISQALKANRDRWTREPRVTALLDDLLGLLRSSGGVMTVGELADGLIALRGTSVEEPVERRRLASALVRVAYEAEQAKAEPRLHLRRSKAGLLLAASPGMADYAEALGAEANLLALEVPLPPTVRVFQRLYEVPLPEFPPDCRRRATSGCSAWPPRRARTRPSRPGKRSTLAGWRRVGRCNSAWGHSRGWRRGSTRRPSASGSRPATPRRNLCPIGPSWTICSARSVWT